MLTTIINVAHQYYTWLAAAGGEHQNLSLLSTRGEGVTIVVN